MLQKARYINYKGESVYLDIKPPFILQRIEGTGGVPVNMQSQKSPHQDGRTFLESTMEARELSLRVTLMATSSEELFKMRQDLQRVFNPKLGEGQLIYVTPNGDKMISCVPDGSPVFGEYNGNTVACQIELIAHNPFWTDVDALPNEEDFSLYLSRFNQAITIPSVDETLSKEGSLITNAGSAYSPLSIEIIGGTTSGVEIINQVTEESIYVVKPIPAGSQLVIDTAFGSSRKVVLVDAEGVETNGFSFVSIYSSFFQLGEGESVLSYESTEEVTITVRWHNCYVGL